MPSPRVASPRVSSAESFVDGFRDFADRTSWAVLGVSGTFPRGAHSFMWSEDAASDFRRVEDALAKASTQLQTRPSGLVLIGFSQGAAMAVELAARHPERFAGAIALSPGLQGTSALAELADNAERHALGIVLSANQGEHPDTLALTSYYERSLRKLSTRVHSRRYPDLSDHVLPPDLDARLVPWLAFVLNPKAENPAGG